MRCIRNKVKINIVKPKVSHTLTQTPHCRAFVMFYTMLISHQRHAAPTATRIHPQDDATITPESNLAESTQQHEHTIAQQTSKDVRSKKYDVWAKKYPVWA